MQANCLSLCLPRWQFDEYLLFASQFSSQSFEILGAGHLELRPPNETTIYDTAIQPLPHWIEATLHFVVQVALKALTLFLCIGTKSTSSLPRRVYAGVWLCNYLEVCELNRLYDGLSWQRRENPLRQARPFPPGTLRSCAGPRLDV